MDALTQEQKELIVVGMELVCEEFGSDKQGSMVPFEVMPSQIYDYCDEVYGADSQEVRGKYKIRPKKPVRRAVNRITADENSRLRSILQMIVGCLESPSSFHNSRQLKEAVGDAKKLIEK